MILIAPDPKTRMLRQHDRMRAEPGPWHIAMSETAEEVTRCRQVLRTGVGMSIEIRDLGNIVSGKLCRACWPYGVGKEGK